MSVGLSRSKGRRKKPKPAADHPGKTGPAGLGMAIFTFSALSLDGYHRGVLRVSKALTRL